MVAPAETLTLPPLQARADIQAVVAEAHAAEIETYNQLRLILRGQNHLPRSMGSLLTDAASRLGVTADEPFVLGDDEGWTVTTHVMPESELHAGFLVVESRRQLGRLKRSTFKNRYTLGLEDAERADQVTQDFGGRRLPNRVSPWLTSADYAIACGQQDLDAVIDHHEDGTPITRRQSIWLEQQGREQTLHDFLLATVNAGNAVLRATEELYS